MLASGSLAGRSMTACFLGLAPLFAAVAEGFGVPVRSCRADGFAAALAWAVACPGPSVVVLRETLRAAEPTP